MSETRLRELVGLEGKRVVVVGGGQGMGESSSRIVATAGADVAVLDLELDRAERVADEVRALGREALALAADVTDDDALRAAIAEVDERWGGFDGLVLIVGMAGFRPLLEMDGDFWDMDQRRNLRYGFVAMQEAARRLVDRGRAGSIVAIASIDGLRSAPYHASYGAAKAGLVNLVKTATAEWMEHGIRVNAVAPGTIATPRIPMSAEDEREHVRLIPAARRGEVEDIGKAVLFFLSDLSSYVSGQTLAVDGGLTGMGTIDYRPMAARTGRAGTLGL